MKTNKQTLRSLNRFFGILTIALFIYSLSVLFWLKPKMINFEPLTNFQDALLTMVGFGLLVIMAFYLLSLWHLVRYIRHADGIKPIPLVLFISGVLSLLFVFSDFALLSDIHKQYRYGLSQPEWAMVFPFMIFQFIIASLFLYIHVTNRFIENTDEAVARDINIFLIVQYVGVICGLMGLALAGLGFVYTSGWNLTIHGIMGGIVLLFPYALVVFYWLATKLGEKDRQWVDEKQILEVGKSALLTLFVDTILMLALFLIHLENLEGIISASWLPIYMFATIFVFSLGNLYFSSKA